MTEELSAIKEMHEYFYGSECHLTSEDGPWIISEVTEHYGASGIQYTVFLRNAFVEIQFSAEFSRDRILDIFVGSANRDSKLVPLWKLMTIVNPVAEADLMQFYQFWQRGLLTCLHGIEVLILTNLAGYIDGTKQDFQETIEKSRNVRSMKQRLYDE